MATCQAGPGWPDLSGGHMPGWPRLARRGSGAQKRGPKNMVLPRNGFQIGDYGISRDPNGLYGTQEAFGKASFPPNPFKKWFPPTFPDFREFGEGPPVPPVYLLWALCGPLSLSNSRSTARGGRYVNLCNLGK